MRGLFPLSARVMGDGGWRCCVPALLTLDSMGAFFLFPFQNLALELNEVFGKF
jgi:hypothetical protein